MYIRTELIIVLNTIFCNKYPCLIIIILSLSSGCNYDYSDWSECDSISNTVSRVLTLRDGKEGCEQTQTITITCNKYNRIQTWKAMKMERKNKRKEQKLQMKQEKKEMKEKRKLIKEQRMRK